MKKHFGTNKPNYYLISIGYLSVFLLLGCGTTKTAMKNPGSPIWVGDKKNMPTIIVDNVITEIPADKVIGHSHQGLLNFVNGTYHGSKISTANSLILKEIETELREAGYPVHEKHGVLFDSTEQEAKVKAILVGGKITYCKFNTYSSVSTNKSEAEVSVRWLLYDPNIKKNIYDYETKGKAEGPAKSVSSISYAVRASFRAALEDENFVNAVSAK